MNRRDFLKCSTSLIGVLAASPLTFSSEQKHRRMTLKIGDGPVREIKFPTGESVSAGDLVPGQAYTVDMYSVLRHA